MNDHPERPWVQAEEPGSNPRNALIIAGFAVLLVMVLGAWLAVGTDAGDQNGPAGPISQEAAAERYCQEEMRGRLPGAPLTAVFDTSTSGTGPSYKVTGTVISENSFGGIRSESFTCEVTLVGDDWRLDNMSGI